MNKISSISHQTRQPGIRGRLVSMMALASLAMILGAATPANTVSAMASADSRDMHPGMAIPKGGVNLLQFTAGGHVLGFTDQRMYVAAGDHALKTEFVGARRVKPQSHGGSQSASSKALPMGEVTYENLWDGVTLVYERDPGGIVRSTYHIAPHAKGSDPVGRIHLAYNAAVSTDTNGNLALGFKTGTMVKSAPVAWQEIGGKKVPVEVSFTVLAGKESGFHAGAYDPAYPLIIDPTLTWNTFLGGAGDDQGNSIAVDAAGNVYVTGSSNATWGAPVRAYTGGLDAFVAKLDANGGLQWNTFLGGAALDFGFGIAVGAAGNVYVTGISDGTWGTPVRAFGGGADAFAARLSGATGALVWNTFLGGTGVDFGGGIAVDSAGNVYVTGASGATWGAPVRAFGGGGDDAFVARIAASASSSPSSPPIVGLANRFFATTGDLFTLTVTVTPHALAGTLVDAYVMYTVPGGQAFYQQLDGTFTVTPMPLISNWPLASVSGALFSHIFTGPEPPGVYSVRVFFYEPGTMTPVGNTATTFVIFLP